MLAAAEISAAERRPQKKIALCNHVEEQRTIRRPNLLQRVCQCPVIRFGWSPRAPRLAWKGAAGAQTRRQADNYRAAHPVTAQWQPSDSPVAFLAPSSRLCTADAGDAPDTAPHHSPALPATHFPRTAASCAFCFRIFACPSPLSQLYSYPLYGFTAT